MTMFSYKAHGLGGETAHGAIHAVDKQAALDLLHKRGLNVFAVSDADTPIAHGIFRSKGFDLTWRAEFYGQLAMLLHAGVTLDRALRLIAGNETKPQRQKLLEIVLGDIVSGSTFALSLGKIQIDFPKGEIAQISAASQIGTLSATLENIAQTLKRRQQLRSAIVSALIYPAFLFAMIPISLTIIALVLVPNLAPLFENAKVPPPTIVKAMMIFSREIHERTVLWAAVMLGLGYLIYFILTDTEIRKMVNVVKHRIPFLGELFATADRARVCQVLGSLIAGGVPLQSALAFASDASDSTKTGAELLRARQKVVEGMRLSTALRETTVFKTTSVQLLAIGEETNQLESILRHLSEAESRRLETRIERLAALLTPVLTVIMGLLVGGTVMSIMRAILSVNDLASQ